MSTVVFAVGDVVPETRSRGTKRRLVSSIGIVVSLTPCEMKMRGLPLASTGVITPGENARMRENELPAPIPKESAYDAPSEWPAMAAAGG